MARIVTACLLLSFNILFAQTSKLMSRNDAVATRDIIDGSKHPELILDSTAYRLWLIAATTEDTAHPDLSEFRRLAILKSAGIKDDDLSAAEWVLSQFKSEYATLLDSYNKGVAANQNPDLAAFVAEREALVTATRDSLRSQLSTDSSANLQAHIHAEKAHMKVAKEVQ